MAARIVGDADLQSCGGSRLDVSGMSCAAYCQPRPRRKLNKIPGVRASVTSQPASRPSMPWAWQP